MASGAGAAAHDDADRLGGGVVGGARRERDRARRRQEPERAHDHGARQLELVEIAIDVAHREVLVGLALGRLVRDVAHDERIERQRRERPIAGADAHEPVLAQRAIAVELAGDRGGVARAVDLRDQVLVDQRPPGIVREDAVQPRELAAQARRRDREQDRYGHRRQVEVAREHVERREPAAARARGAVEPLLATAVAAHGGGEGLGRAPGDQPQQAADLVGERRPREVRLADPAAVPRVGDRDMHARADELEAEVERQRDLVGGGGRRDRDGIEPDERRVGQRLVAGRGGRLGRGRGRGARLRWERRVELGRRLVGGRGRLRGLVAEGRRRRERVGANELEARRAAEREPRHRIVDRELGHARRQHEIADPPAEAQVEQREAIAAAHDREAAPRREQELTDLRQAQLGLLHAVGDRGDRQA